MWDIYWSHRSESEHGIPNISVATKMIKIFCIDIIGIKYLLWNTWIKLSCILKVWIELFIHTESKIFKIVKRWYREDLSTEWLNLYLKFNWYNYLIPYGKSLYYEDCLRRI